MYKTMRWERNMMPFMNAIYRQWGYKINRRVSSKKYDLMLTRVNEEKTYAWDVPIEEKYNFTNRTYDRFLVEVQQDTETNELGWLYYCQAHWLMWAYCPPDHVSQPLVFWLLQWKEVKRIAKELLVSGDYEKSIVTEGYGRTFNIKIPFSDLPGHAAYKYTYKDFWRQP